MLFAIQMVIKNNEFVTEQIVLKVSAGYNQKSSLTWFQSKPFLNCVDYAN
jgi:hypothetical protein